MNTRTSKRRKSAQKIRIPLDHPETEALGKRIHNRAGVLNEDECGRLIKKERELRKVDRSLARVFLGAPLPETDCRPLYPDEWQMLRSIYWERPSEIVQTGWVFALRDYVEKLEQKYFGGSWSDAHRPPAARQTLNPAMRAYYEKGRSGNGQRARPVVANVSGDPGETEYDPETGEIVADSDDPDRQTTDDI